MDNLNFVNLIQASIITTSILGGILLWKSYEYRGLALLLALSALASLINILEETNITREIYLVSPVFIMLFGPATYLATKFMVYKRLNPYQWLHLAPLIPFLLSTSYIKEVIALGTVWRLVYSVMTVLVLIQYKRQLDEQRSDSDEYSFHWLISIIAITSAFTIVDLVRLNSQHLISVQLNIFGQGFHNAIWLISMMAIIVILTNHRQVPQSITKNEQPQKPQQPLIKGHQQQTEDEQQYRRIFIELDELIRANQWFLTPRLTLSDMSNFTGLQSREISRAINIHTQKSFNEYINDYRVEHFCQLLANQPKASLTELSSQAGFSSKATFNKAFKQVKGCTPSEYKTK